VSSFLQRHRGKLLLAFLPWISSGNTTRTRSILVPRQAGPLTMSLGLMVTLCPVLIP
jgi:hypothetical protein